MSKRDVYHKNLDKILSVFLANEETPVELEEKTMADGTVITYDNMEIGTPVMVMVEGQDPAPAPDGEYPVSDNETLVVVDGVISEVMTTEEAPEEVVVVEAEEEKKTVSVEEVFNLETLKSKIDFDKEGFHTITFSIANGKIEWGNLYSESFQELKEEHQVKSEKVIELEKQVETMKADHEAQLKLLGETVKSSGIIQAPVEQKTQPKTWKEIKMESLKQARKENQL